MTCYVEQYADIKPNRDRSKSKENRRNEYLPSNFFENVFNTIYFSRRVFSTYRVSHGLSTVSEFRFDCGSYFFTFFFSNGDDNIGNDLINTKCPLYRRPAHCVRL